MSENPNSIASRFSNAKKLIILPQYPKKLYLFHDLLFGKVLVIDDYFHGDHWVKIAWKSPILLKVPLEIANSLGNYSFGLALHLIHLPQYSR